MNKILVLDNYDSFTYNLVQILHNLGYADSVHVVRNDQFDLEEVNHFDHILLSPGPGLPKDAGLMPQMIQRYAPQKNILGVCLGHQAIGEAFNCKLYNLPKVFHGVVTHVHVIEKDKIFESIPQYFEVCRYHSWGIVKDSINSEIIVTSETENGDIMSIKHRKYRVRGVQFHPESFVSQYGEKLISNWLSY